MPSPVKCFTEYLRANGYFCSNNSKTDYPFDPPATAWDESNGEAHWRNRKSPNQPFFYVFNIFETHESRIWIDTTLPLTVSPNDVKLLPYYPDHSAIRRDLARHYNNIERMDLEVGRIIAELKADGLYDNTIIFFYGDHGDGMPRSKRAVYGTGLKVPMIIGYPGNLTAGTKNNHLISFLDLAPTVLTMAGITPPNYLMGVPITNEAALKNRHYLIGHRDRMDPERDRDRCIFNNQYRYIRHYNPELPYAQKLPYRDRMATMQVLWKMKKEGTLPPIAAKWMADTKPTEELYDYIADPYEINNLATSPNFKAIKETLAQALDSMLLVNGDKGAIDEYLMVGQMWPNGVRPKPIR